MHGACRVQTCTKMSTVNNKTCRTADSSAAIFPRHKSKPRGSGLGLGLAPLDNQCLETANWNDIAGSGGDASICNCSTHPNIDPVEIHKGPAQANIDHIEVQVIVWGKWISGNKLEI